MLNWRARMLLQVVVDGWRAALRAGRTGAKDAIVSGGGLDRGDSFKNEALASIGVWAGGYPNHTPSEIVPSDISIVLDFLGVEIFGSPRACSEALDVPAPETWESNPIRRPHFR